VSYLSVATLAPVIGQHAPPEAYETRRIDIDPKFLAQLANPVQWLFAGPQMPGHRNIESTCE
jgi:hypothetical protein